MGGYSVSLMEIQIAPKHSFFVVFSLCKAIRQARKKEGSSRKIVGVPMASTSLNTVGPVLIRTETIRG